MSQVELLAEKYKSCVTCQHRIMKQHKGKDHMAWCVQHRHPIKYDMHQDEKGTWALNDYPCEDWAYQRQTYILSVRSKSDPVGEQT